MDPLDWTDQQKVNYDQASVSLDDKRFCVTMISLALSCRLSLYQKFLQHLYGPADPQYRLSKVTLARLQLLQFALARLELPL